MGGFWVGKGVWYCELLLLLLLLLLLKVGVKGWRSESLELVSLSDEKDGECSCGVPVEL